jgi:hypothetical protein
MWATLTIFKITTQSNQSPLGENSPNLVTLRGKQVADFFAKLLS